MFGSRDLAKGVIEREDEDGDSSRENNRERLSQPIHTGKEVKKGYAILVWQEGREHVSPWYKIHEHFHFHFYFHFHFQTQTHRSR